MFGLREIKGMKEKGITLVALVITIVILLILAGISISTLTNTGIFQKEKEVKQKSEEAENEQNKILDEYETELDQYNENTLVYKVNNGIVKIGDYVAYTPDDASTKEILEELGNYSGSKENTNLTLTQEKNLSWRVLDVKDGCVRLISEKPTTSKITLYSYDGYNNAVKLLDDVCSNLYSNSKLSKKVQNLKIDDILIYMSKQPEMNLTVYNYSNIRYPKILEQEENQMVANSVLPKLGLSTQDNWVTGKDTTTSSTLKNTFWSYAIRGKGDFKEDIYYELFINNFLAYWLSSRCVNTFSWAVSFDVRVVDYTNISSWGMYASDVDKTKGSCCFRPVVTLNSGVQLDATKVADGSDADHAYAIK